ncbi:MAG TPA: hypothetical protein VFL76_04250 [Edaphocola sp.]|nr:hypothetical protein [Edaphocola sp.]
MSNKYLNGITAQVACKFKPQLNPVMKSSLTGTMRQYKNNKIGCLLQVSDLE